MRAVLTAFGEPLSVGGSGAGGWQLAKKPLQAGSTEITDIIDGPWRMTITLAADLLGVC